MPVSDIIPGAGHENRLCEGRPQARHRYLRGGERSPAAVAGPIPVVHAKHARELSGPPVLEQSRQLRCSRIQSPMVVDQSQIGSRFLVAA